MLKNKVIKSSPQTVLLKLYSTKHVTVNTSNSENEEYLPVMKRKAPLTHFQTLSSVSGLTVFCDSNSWGTLLNFTPRNRKVSPQNSFIGRIALISIQVWETEFLFLLFFWSLKSHNGCSLFHLLSFRLKKIAAALITVIQLVVYQLFTDNQIWKLTWCLF